MELLKSKYHEAQKAITSLEQLLKEQDDLLQLKPIMELIIRESLIKRFEYSIDTLWKYLKLYLETKHGVVQKSPKSVFKELLRVGVIGEEETRQALEMVDDRNLTAHTYNEEIAQEIMDSIPQYHGFMQAILKKSSP